MAIFTKKTGARVGSVGLNRVVDELLAQAAAGGRRNDAAARAALSMESLSDVESQTLRTAADDLSTSLESMVSTLKLEPLTAAQLDAATAAGILAGDMKAFFGRKLDVPQISTENMSVVSTYVEDGFAQRSLSFEAYDERENRNAAVYSIAYNMQASRQDEFAETFFPTIVVTPDNVGFAITVRLMTVFNDLQRSVTGAVDNYNKKNIIRAIADPTILKNEQTRVIPVYRAQSADKFAAGIASHDLSLEGEVIPTAPLAVGKKVSLLGISQTEALLQSGIADVTDSLDSAISLTNLYIKVGDDIIQITTNTLPLSQFTYSTQNNYRLMSLNFDTASALLSKKTSKIDGADLTTLAAIKTNDLAVRLSLTASGSSNLETSETVVYGNNVSVHSVTAANGDVLALSSGVGKDIADLFASATIIGYDLLAYRSNVNRRQRGQLIDTTFNTRIYNVNLRAPITALHPVTADGQSDASDLQALIATTRIRTSNAAVASLIQAANVLNEYVSAHDANGTIPDILGVGSQFLIPTFMHEDLKMSELVDSMSSHKRAEDMQAALVNKLRDAAYRMYRDSEYKAAADALSGGLSKTPTVIIGTDPVIARYLNVTGDLRTLGGEFDVRIVSTLDNRVAGKIFMTFGVFDEQRNVAPNPLNFGNMAWSPELTVVLPISRNGQISKETAVQPRFLHVVHMPVMATFTVSELPDVTNKVALFVKQQ